MSAPSFVSLLLRSSWPTLSSETSQSLHILLGVRVLQPLAFINTFKCLPSPRLPSHKSLPFRFSLLVSLPLVLFALPVASCSSLPSAHPRQRRPSLFCFPSGYPVSATIHAIIINWKCSEHKTDSFSYCKRRLTPWLLKSGHLPRAPRGQLPYVNEALMCHRMP